MPCLDLPWLGLPLPGSTCLPWLACLPRTRCFLVGVFFCSPSRHLPGLLARFVFFLFLRLRLRAWRVERLRLFTFLYSSRIESSIVEAEPSLESSRCLQLALLLFSLARLASRWAISAEAARIRLLRVIWVIPRNLTRAFSFLILLAHAADDMGLYSVSQETGASH